MDINAYLRENLHPIPTCKCYFAPDIPPRKLKSAVKTIAKSKTAPEDVVALWDDSMLETARSGFLFTATALYWMDNKGRRYFHIPYHEIQKAEIVDRVNAFKQLRHQLQLTLTNGNEMILLEEGNDLSGLAACINGLLEHLGQAIQSLSLEEIQARKAALEAKKRELAAQLEAMADPAAEQAKAQAVRRQEEAAARRREEQEILPVEEAFAKAAQAVEEGDYPQAVKWFRQAAGQEDPVSKYNLGVLYEQGLGVEQDLEKAVGWYQEAAAQKDPDAQCALGVLYIQGKGMPADQDMGRYWLEKAANQGHQEAAHHLQILGR